MLIKLYKNIEGVRHYFEAWDDGNEVVVHWGELGRVGKNKAVTVGRDETAESVIERELSLPRSSGYEVIDIDDHKTLIIQYKTETWGSVKDLNKRYEVEEIVNETLGWTGNGHCDGGQIGSGSIEVFAFVIDPQIACKSLVIDLEGKGRLDGAVIAYKNEEEALVVLYPRDFQGSFNFI